MSTVSWLLLLLAVLAMLAFLWERGRVGRGNRRRARVALRAESDAERLLEELGFEVVERQVRAVWSLWVDGEEREVGCRADLLVARGGEEFVAEVKSGELAPDPLRPATRRQLLEYGLAFEVEGVLLVDMAERRVLEIRLPLAIGPP